MTQQNEPQKPDPRAARESQLIRMMQTRVGQEEIARIYMAVKKLQPGMMRSGQRAGVMIEAILESEFPTKS